MHVLENKLYRCCGETLTPRQRKQMTANLDGERGTLFVFTDTNKVLEQRNVVSATHTIFSYEIVLNSLSYFSTISYLTFNVKVILMQNLVL